MTKIIKASGKTLSQNRETWMTAWPTAGRDGSAGTDICLSIFSGSGFRQAGPPKIGRPVSMVEDVGARRDFSSGRTGRHQVGRCGITVGEVFCIRFRKVFCIRFRKVFCIRFRKVFCIRFRKVFCIRFRRSWQRLCKS
jgi:hypothetical protein